MTDEVSTKKGEERLDRPESNREESGNFDRQSDRELVDEFEKICTQGDETSRSEEHDNVKERPSEEGDNWNSEYDSYEEW